MLGGLSSLFVCFLQFKQKNTILQNTQFCLCKDDFGYQNVSFKVKHLIFYVK